MRPEGIVLIIFYHLQYYIVLRVGKLTVTQTVIYDKNFRHWLADWLAGSTLKCHLNKTSFMALLTSDFVLWNF